MTLVAWLIALIGPMAVRVIVALGFTAVTFTAVSVLANELISIAQSNWAGLPLTVLQLSALSGIPEVLGMISAAYMARVATWASINGIKYVLK